MPSSRVDEAVMAAIAARRKGGIQGDAILPGTRRGEGGVDERKGPLGRPGEEEGTRATTRREVRDVPRREGSGRVRLGWGAIAAAAIAAVQVFGRLAIVRFIHWSGSQP